MFTFALAIVALLAGLIGCEKVVTMMPEDEKPADEVVIGIAVDETGGNSEAYGLPMKRGLVLAQEELNMAGANIKFVSMDAMGTIEGAKTAVQALVDKDVSAIVGIGISTHLKQAFPIAQAAGIVAFSPISSAAGLSGEVGDFVFRAGIATNILIPGGVMKTHAALNYENVAIIYDETDVYSTSLKDELEKALAANSIMVQSTEKFKTKDTEFSTQLTNIMNLDPQPDVLFVASLSDEMILIMKEAGDLGITANTQLIIPDLTDFEVNAVGAAADGAIAFAGWSSLSETPGNQDFVQAYMMKYDNRTPEPWAAQAYATLYILANAIHNAASTDSMDIRDTLAMTSHLPTILGPFSFDPNGEAIYENIETIVQQVMEGKLVDLK